MNTMKTEMSLSRAELKTLFYTGRELELVACYCSMPSPQKRTVAAQRSYGYDMWKDGGPKVSSLRFETGNSIVGVSEGNGFTEIKIVDNEGTVAAHYRLLTGLA